ncbi:MAG TPA: MarR family transcriptional regulator [Alphaproteobacteria bacterium]|nr:MarR family transcriptional regulator [Alphaproteobacteria bacterium]
MPKVSEAQYEMLAAFRYELRRFMRFSESAAQRVGLTPQQHQALLAVRGYPQRARMTVGELAERLQIRHHSAVGLVDRMVSQGLLERESGAEDRRTVHIRLTAAADALLERLSAAHQAELRRIGPSLRGLLDRLAAED